MKETERGKTGEGIRGWPQVADMLGLGMLDRASQELLAPRDLDERFISFSEV